MKSKTKIIVLHMKEIIYTIIFAALGILLILLHQTEAKYFVTKESGKNGGFAEKLEAAEQAGAVLLVIGRPIEEGLSVEEAEQEMRKWNRD